MSIASRPILFTPAMAQAIAEGRKTQTRRVIKAWTSHPAVADWVLDSEGRAAARAHNEEVARQYVTTFPHARVLCPYGVPGDRLWVRERVARDESDDGQELLVYRGDGETWVADWSRGTKESKVNWKTDADRGLRWRPNIHMPRWACRSVLEVVSVRVERVESINEADALAEGMHEFKLPRGSVFGHNKNGTPCPDLGATAREAFLRLFYRINKRAPEGSNPWVWVVEFKRLEGVKP